MDALAPEVDVDDPEHDCLPDPERRLCKEPEEEPVRVRDLVEQRHELPRLGVMPAFDSGHLGASSSSRCLPR
jgi:hypothetical protein